MLSRLSSSAIAIATLVSGGILLNATQAQAQLAPIDESAYADGVVEYTRGESDNWGGYFSGANDSEQWQVYDPNSALGVANWNTEMTSGGSLGQWDKEIGVSLGRGGSLTLEFTDNYLTGSSDEKSDLWIFEIGGVAEKTFVEISMDGQSWFDVGVADRQDYQNDWGVGIDIDGLLATNELLDTNSLFSFVRLTDTGTNNYRNFKAGADIDAVAALSSAPKDSQDVPEPGVAIALGLFSVGFLRRRLLG
jgi:hypothetical protein